jgi:hypothetical protein
VIGRDRTVTASSDVGHRGLQDDVEHDLALSGPTSAPGGGNRHGCRHRNERDERAFEHRIKLRPSRHPPARRERVIELWRALGNGSGHSSPQTRSKNASSGGLSTRCLFLGPPECSTGSESGRI